MADIGHYPDSVGEIKTSKGAFGMTSQQRALLTFVCAFSESNGGVMPSFDEMAEHLGLASKSGVHRLIVALEERGYIERNGRKARAIRLVGREGGDGLSGAIRRVLGECALSAITRRELAAILSAMRPCGGVA